jgi:hypothetical protein
MINPDLLNHPVVQKEAERLARELWAIQAPLFEADGWNTAHDPDDEDAVEGFALCIEGHARLLSDPDRPETRDYLVRSANLSHYKMMLLRNDPAALVREWLEVMK